MDRTFRGKQQRSRQRFAELVSATIKILDRDGLAGATIPRIAVTTAYYGYIVAAGDRVRADA